MKKRNLLITGSLALVMLVGGTFAYFTDTKEVTNPFSAGNVTTELVEEHWDTTDKDNDGIPDAAQNIVPGQTISKDPKVKNVGKNEAYVFLEVTVPTANIVTANDNGTRKAAATVELFSYTVNGGWTQMDKTTNADNVVYLYYYNKTVAPGKESGTLFDRVTFVNAIEGQGLEDTPQEINVKSMAIQSEGFGSPQEAYNTYAKQNAGN